VTILATRAATLATACAARASSGPALAVTRTATLVATRTGRCAGTSAGATASAAAPTNRLKHLGCDDAVRRHLAHEVGHDARLSVDSLGANADLRFAEQVRSLALLFGQHHGDNVACGTRTRGTAGAVEVRLVLGGRVNVDNKLDAIDVHPACSDIGSDKHTVGVAAKESKVAVTLTLRQVPVQINGGDAGSREIRGELLRLMLGACEEDATAKARGKRLNHLALRLGAVDVEHVVGHRLDGTVSLLDGMRHRGVKKAAHELVDAVVQRG